ncbi:MAG: prepilin-type N-terminal cleavage/methylation domain-containing protein [Desulfomonilaceae bacterium]|nr:prepilin-type N-terminal cleavage/methylation domain-containing protein [Desulfomonilaceae bacterium]
MKRGESCPIGIHLRQECVRSRQSGFTLVELMVVCAVMALALAVSLPLGSKWLTDYRYSAACRSFYNAIHLAKIHAISGSTMFNVTNIKGTGTDLEVTTAPVYFRCDHTPDINKEGDYPVTLGTAVALDGFVEPSYVNSNVFEVKETPTVNGIVDHGKGLWEARLTLKLSSDRIQWTGDEDSNTGKAWTVAAAKFVTTQARQTALGKKMPVYSVYKMGGTIRCEFDPSVYHVEVNGTSAESATTVIVFDSKGAPKNLDPYTILVQRKKPDGSVSTEHPPFTITVQTSGKILSGG